MAITTALTSTTPPTDLRPVDSRGPEFVIAEDRRTGSVVLHLHGALRLVDAEVLVGRVEALWTEQPRTIILDLAGLTTGDELGVLVLPSLVRRARSLGVGLTLAAPSPVLGDRLRQLGFRHRGRS